MSKTENHPLNRSPGMDGSDAFLDGYRRLAMAVLLQAAADVQEKGTFRQADKGRRRFEAFAALYWLLTDGPVWLEALDFPADPFQLVVSKKVKPGDNRVT